MHARKCQAFKTPGTPQVPAVTLNAIDAATQPPTQTAGRKHNRRRRTGEADRGQANKLICCAAPAQNKTASRRKPFCIHNNA